MYEDLQHLKREVRGKNIFIFGGGASLENFDYTVVENEITFAINDAYRFLPNATVIYWVDDTWISENYDNVMAHKCKYKITSKFSQHLGNRVTKGIANSIILKRTGDNGFDPNLDSVRGNNSGVQLLNLAINLQPKNIILMGYDMKKTNKKSHFHNFRRPHIKDSIYTDLFIPSINSLAQEFNQKSLNINIVNANTDSAVRCFRFDLFEKYINPKTKDKGDKNE